MEPVGDPVIEDLIREQVASIDVPAGQTTLPVNVTASIEAVAHSSLETVEAVE